MKKTLLFLSLLLFSSVTFAKDLLVPAFIDKQGYFDDSLFNFNRITPQEKKTIESIKEKKQDHADGVVITRITPDVKTEEVKKVEDPKELLLKSITPIAKALNKEPVVPNIPVAELELEPIFNIPSFKLQSMLSCPITPNLKVPDINKPSKFNRTNNARRKTKNPEVSSGHVLYIRGRVLDINCVPIQGAIVKLWQANAYGGFNYQLKKYDPKYDPYFGNSAVATSDNTGRFDFITILPGRTTEKYAPDLNFNAKHKNFAEIRTKYFFPDNKFNEQDGRFMSLDPVSKELLTGILLPINPDNFDEGYYYLVDLVFDGVSRFRN